MNEGLYDVLTAGYFNKDEVKRHAFVELMTLKTILINKGLFTLEEFNSVREKVDQEVTKEVRDQIDKMKEDNPKEATVMNVLNKLFSGLKKDNSNKEKEKA